MYSNRNTLLDNKAIKGVISNILEEHGYEILTSPQLEKKKETPSKYVLTKAKYKSIYNHDTSSDFLIVNFETNLRLRVDVKFQKSSGSVDEKLPYFYLNSVITHTDDVLFIVEGDGFKRGAKLWLKEQVASQWLNTHGKKIYMKSLAGGVELLEGLIQ